MIIKKLYIKGLFEITPEPHFDHRGFFMRTYDQEIFRQHGIDRDWVQENHSRSEKAGTIRGLHYQLAPFSETKLARCIRGRVFDVAVDLRKESETFGKWFGIDLSEENRKMLLIPQGFAHGFCTLTDEAEVVYKVDNIYTPSHEIGILWSDEDLRIQWPLSGTPVISEKDSKNMTFREFKEMLNTLE
ncbi:MAG TPA: dTDP-4-dehydrorhamnose 3,5-epimerase [Bacteroidales bacterium]|nr:dTDP-4-dehydrorhamnose 3,5-epimerase [Bacteroidales bacterium]